MAYDGLSAEKKSRIKKAWESMGNFRLEHYLLDLGPAVAASTNAAKTVRSLVNPGQNGARAIYTPEVVLRAVREEMLVRWEDKPEPPVPSVRDVTKAAKSKFIYLLTYYAVLLSSKPLN